MNKTDLIHKIKQLEGISQDEKAYLINLVNTKKKYGLVWEDKPEEVEEQLRHQLPILKEVVEKRIEGKPIPNEKEDAQTLFSNPSNLSNPTNQGSDNFPNHILIEGDNLHALTALSFTHEGKVDVMYFDPPYNRGENDFKYNDNYIDKENPFKHSLWLSFIHKRFKIAKTLLSETGVIIIHIDEHEFDALNLLMETELFGESNSLGQIIWNKQNPKGDAKGIATMHEYILVYAKNKLAFTELERTLQRPKPNATKILNKAKRLFSKIGKTEIPEDIKEVVKPFNFSKEILNDFKVKYDLELVNKEFQSWLSRQDFSGGEKAYKFIDGKGEVYRGVSMAWPNKDKAPDDYFIPLIHPITQKPCPIPARGWRNPSTTMKSLLKDKLILFGDNETKQPERKYLLRENLFENTPSIYNSASSDDELLKDFGVEFPYPKPVDVAAYFLKAIHPNPKIIVDIFGGSGTTLHATMQLNAEDGGSRQCILVSNNENNICEEVTYVRNKRVIEGYSTTKALQIEGLSNNNLRYYKTEFVPSQKSEANKRILTQASTDLLSIKENCYNDITQANGFNTNQCRIFTNNLGKYLMIVYHSRNQIQVCEKLVEFIKTIHHLSEKIRLYGFSPEKETLTEDFIDVADKIEAVPLPEAIYNAYRATFRTIKLDKKPPIIASVTENETTLFNDIPNEA